MPAPAKPYPSDLAHRATLALRNLGCWTNLCLEQVDRLGDRLDADTVDALHQLANLATRSGNTLLMRHKSLRRLAPPQPQQTPDAPRLPDVRAELRALPGQVKTLLRLLKALEREWCQTQGQGLPGLDLGLLHTEVRTMRLALGRWAKQIGAALSEEESQ